jgi:hypothetical protein
LLLFCSSTWWPERQMTGNLPSYQSFRKFTWSPALYGKKSKGQVQRLKSVILATWEAEIERIMVQDQLRQNVWEAPSLPMAEHGGICLSSQLCREAQVEGSLCSPA